ncbi:MAG: 16S rRNA (uracil(1498)-N(3))-methyltransferase [Candidatus Omnitrophica bacterium]|nr:16S rRNA (uracil(1498)-N(3))-methyltransferase [Candidatus Omnitrophota bacterium]MCM8808584.1 16S rRNA (uracil(1498)-N(3))-methyltransferase [Candidatus Omnitrophota bacterium]MCM8810882.1 16S rRNA (uracil(1498)-N(3))-methyltransferase [Candidatus Omnitrophota bacterium]
MRRIYFGNDCFRLKDRFYIRGETFHYLKNVLRFKKGIVFIGFDGTGKEFTVEIEKIDKKEILGKILEERGIYSSELNFNLQLFQCIPKGDKFDFIIREVTQLGVKKIVPVISKRTIARIPEEKIENKIKRWNRIAEEASKISKRTFVPEISEILNFEESIKEEKDIGIIFWEGEKERSIKDVIKHLSKDKIIDKRINVFIGPEGGFDQDEIKLAIENHYLPTSLGKRILKVETASLLSIGILIYELENLCK